MEANSDQFYINNVLKGETDAFTFLIEKYKNMVYSIAIKIVKSKEDAEEIAQDSFLKAFQKLDTFKGDSKFSTWLYTIAYRNAISLVRKRKIETTSIDAFVIENHSTDVEFPSQKAIKNKEQQYYINKAINGLPETDRLLITLYYLHECSVEEIEKITSLKQSNIKVKLFRARKKLYMELAVLLKNEVKSIL